MEINTHQSHHHFHHQCSEYLKKWRYALEQIHQTAIIQMYVCVRPGGYNLQDVVFYWTRGNDSVKGLDTLRLAQYSVESYHTSVSEAVYETGISTPRIPLYMCSYMKETCLAVVTLCVSSQENTPSWCCILPCVGTCCSLSWRHMFLPLCLWFSPGSHSGSANPLSQQGPALVSNSSHTSI